MNPTNPIKFGTDGWRAVIAEDFTFANVRICAQGVVDYLKSNSSLEKSLVIGYDTRFASRTSQQPPLRLLLPTVSRSSSAPKPIPTPEVSFGVTAMKAGAAIVITASHNPARYNGFKIKSTDGASAPTEMIDAIEKNIQRIFESGKVERIPLEDATKQKLVERFNFDPLYLMRMAGFVDLERIKKSGLKIVADSMFGAGSGYFKNLLDGGATSITEINSERNPSFPGINPEPIAVNLKKLSSAVKTGGASVGLATDGDADRIGIIDEKGNFVTQLEVYALLALHLLEDSRAKGADR